MAFKPSLSTGKAFTLISIILYFFLHSARGQEDEVVHRIVEDEQTRIKLHCEMAREFRSQFVKWYFNDQMLFRSSNIRITYPTTTDEWMNSTLDISNLSMAHNGSYVCRASNGKLLRTYVVHVQSSCVPCPDQSYCFNGGRCCNESGFEMCLCNEAWQGERCDARVASSRIPIKLDETRVQQLIIACSVIGSALFAVAAMVFVCRKSSSKKEIVKDDDYNVYCDAGSLTGCHVEEQHQFRRTTESKSPLLNDKNSCVVWKLYVFSFFYYLFLYLFSLVLHLHFSTLIHSSLLFRFIFCMVFCLH